MDKKTAKELIETFVGLDASFSKASELTRNIEDKDEQIKFRQSLGEIIGDIYTELIIPIIRQYPELDPEKDK